MNEWNVLFKQGNLVSVKINAVINKIEPCSIQQILQCLSIYKHMKNLISAKIFIYLLTYEKLNIMTKS